MNGSCFLQHQVVGKNIARLKNRCIITHDTTLSLNILYIPKPKYFHFLYFLGLFSDSESVYVLLKFYIHPTYSQSYFFSLIVNKCIVSLIIMMLDMSGFFLRKLYFLSLLDSNYYHTLIICTKCVIYMMLLISVWYSSYLELYILLLIWVEVPDCFYPRSRLAQKEEIIASSPIISPGNLCQDHINPSCSRGTKIPPTEF